MITDTDGYYEFNLASGYLHVEIHIGCKEETRISLTSASQTLSLDVVLKEESCI